MGIVFKKAILCSSNYNDLEHKPAIGGVELNYYKTRFRPRFSIPR